VSRRQSSHVCHGGGMIVAHCSNYHVPEWLARSGRICSLSRRSWVSLTHYRSRRMREYESQSEHCRLHPDRLWRHLVPARHQRPAGQLHDRANSVGGLRRDRGGGRCGCVGCCQTPEPMTEWSESLCHVPLAFVWPVRTPRLFAQTVGRCSTSASCPRPIYDFQSIHACRSKRVRGMRRVSTLKAVTDDSMTATMRDKQRYRYPLPLFFLLVLSCHSVIQSCYLRAESMRSQMTGSGLRSDTFCHSVTRISLNLRACFDFFRLRFLA
jgi:hypothetical protein